MSITILKSGVCDTIQDYGRFGLGAYGINPNGVMDRLAMQTANALVGNDENSAVIELHFPASELFFNQGVLLALCGADFQACIQLQDGSEKEAPINKTIFVPGQSKLFFKERKKGERCYLAVNGGFNLKPWLNSNSTNLKVQHGGLNGNTLKKGEELHLKEVGVFQTGRLKVYPWTANFYSWYYDENSYNIIPGPEWDWLDAASQKLFSRSTFEITRHSDRMGITLNGPVLSQSNQEQLVSSGVTYGTIQLLPNGQLIVLAADHPTTGGYPRIANIISIHLPKLSQASPGTHIRFLTTTAGNALDLYLQQQKELIQVQYAVKLQLQMIR